jgi:hypothetical protein
MEKVKYYTQYNSPRSKGEGNSGETLVTKRKVQPMSTKVADCILNGAKVQAEMVEFDYQADSQIPNEIKAIPNGMDVTEKMEYVRILRQRTQEFMKTKYDEEREKEKAGEQTNTSDKKGKKATEKTNENAQPSDSQSQAV